MSQPGFTAIVLAILFSLFCTEGLADDKETLKVGIEDIDYFPHLSIGYKENSFAQIVLERFFKEQGYRVIFVPLPVKRFNDWFLTRDVDFKYPDNPVWRSDEKHGIRIVYSQPLVHSVAGVIRTRSNLGKPFEQIRLVGTMLGFYPQMWYEQIQKGEIELFEETNPRTVVQLPLKGLVDAIGIDYSVINYYLKEIGRQGELLMDPSLPHTRIGFSLSTIEQQDIIHQFDLFISDNQTWLHALKKEMSIIEDPVAYTRAQMQN